MPNSLRDNLEEQSPHKQEDDRGLDTPDFQKISLTTPFVREAGLGFENQTCVIRADDFPQ